MLSIVPLMAGGGLFEAPGREVDRHPNMSSNFGEKKATCAGIRWVIPRSSCFARTRSETFKNPKAAVLAKTLDQAIGKILGNNRSPARKVGELDNRGTHFYLAPAYWAQALAGQTEDKALQAQFTPLAQTLTDNEAKILGELISAQGKPVDMGGYYHPDFAKTLATMRPSTTFNAALAAIA